MGPEEFNPGLPVVNPELRTQVLGYAKKINEFTLKLIKKHEETYERFLVIFNPKNKKKLNFQANQTRVLEKKRENSLDGVGNCQTRGYSRNPASASEIVADVSVRSTRRAAQIADMKNKSCLALSLNQKLRQPSLVLETPASKRNQGAEVSPAPPAKYRRTKNKQNAGNSYVCTKESTEEIVVTEASSTSHSHVMEADKMKKKHNIKIEEEYCSSTAGRIAIQIDNIKLMAPNYVTEDSECFKQLSTVAVVNIEKQTHKIATVSDSGISEEEYHVENELEIRKTSRAKDLKIGEVENCGPSSEENKKNIQNSNAFEENNLNIVDQETNEIITKPQTRTKVLKKPVLNTNNVINEMHENNKKQNIEKETSTIRTRTKKKLKTKDNLFSDTSDDSERETNKIRTRTKVLKTNCNTSDDIEKENSLVQTKTEVLKTKGIHPETPNDVFLDDTKTSKVKKETKILKANYDKSVKRVAIYKAYELPQSELVKKRIEEFEKVLDKPVDSSSRITRTKTKALKADVSTDKIGTPATKHNVEPAVISMDRPIIQNIHLEGKRKEEEMSKKLKKTEAAAKKKEKTLKAASEETRRRREEKLQKVTAARQAVEKEKAAVALKLEKEKEERERQMQLDKEKQKEEITRKKLITQQKILEAEERRKLDEAVRLAKIQEQEAEQKRILANRQKEQEAAERLRQMEELRTKEAEILKKNQKLYKLAPSNAKFHDKVEKSAECTTYDMTPHRDERPIIKPKTENDYGLMDCHTDDSSDDEEVPKKKVPQWALAINRSKVLHDQKYASHYYTAFMTCNPNPDLKEIFSENGLPLKRFHRTSSAVWTTPPIHQTY